MKRVIVIGAGIAGMSAAATLAKEGHQVTIVEKNHQAGGRINKFSAEGYNFDMGPSWYWMPQVFEDFYQKFGYTTSDFYQLTRLDPSYKVIFNNRETIDIPADFGVLLNLFESIEPGSALKLKKFLAHAEYKYQVGMDEFVWKPGNSIFEFADLRVLKSAFRLQMFSSIAKEIRKVVKDDRLRQILEFPVLFLGATPKDTPALYSLMNYADIKLGTWYPEGGMYNIASTFEKIAKSVGVNFVFNQAVQGFEYQNSKINSVITPSQRLEADVVIANADYHHVDKELLSENYSSYSKQYWNSRKLAPSSLLVFVGVSKKLDGLEHHNLFFDADFNHHAHQIYKEPAWPEDPLFYVCCPSRTDSQVAPPNKENLFILLPVAPGLADDLAINECYFDLMISRIEKHLGAEFKSDIEYRKFFSVSDFSKLYNSYKGNAYGLANTISQTAYLKPSLKSKKISNLFFTGQLTTPGPGLPPSIISGQVVASEVMKLTKK